MRLRSSRNMAVAAPPHTAKTATPKYHGKECISVSASTFTPVR